jgi:hypothetical protein
MKKEIKDKVIRSKTLDRIFDIFCKSFICFLFVVLSYRVILATINSEIITQTKLGESVIIPSNDYIYAFWITYIIQLSGAIFLGSLIRKDIIKKYIQKLTRRSS